MAGILSGLEKLGLGNLKDADLYDEAKKDEKDAGKITQLKQC